MPWRRSRDKDVCPLHNRPVVSSSAKWFPVPCPCIRGDEVCEHLSQHYTGRWNTSVRCRYSNKLKEATLGLVGKPVRVGFKGPVVGRVIDATLNESS